ncbi:hypothetical protein LZ31DRAFT_177105 [Colletotrichum somersetense]|nr:hypothetical protein LZ31DRAFT_177105 [Colletotrichum somersetense]
MTSLAGPSLPKAGLSAYSQGHQEIFDEFVSVVGRFYTDKNFQSLRATMLDHDPIQHTLDDTKTAYDRNLGELTRMITDRTAERERFKKQV